MRYRFTTQALTFFIVAHVAALLTMALLLEPGLRPTIAVSERAAYVASNPWAWRIGWLPWQLCALSNLLFSWTLAHWLWKRPGGRWAFASLLLTVSAVIPEQWAELWLVTDYITLADRAVTAAGLAAYAKKELWVFEMTGPYANTSYVAMTLAWIVSLARASGDVDARWMTRIGVLMCVPFAGASVVVYRATRTPELIGLEQSIPLNAVAFPLLLVWSLYAAVLIRRIHRHRFSAGDESLHALSPSWLVWLADLRDVFRPLPFMTLESDVRDVVYLNWLVPVERAERLLPDGLVLDRIGNRTALSILTYTHGCFGPAAAGPLRGALPSPHQSNWRLYVEPADSVYFIKSVISSLLYTCGSRLMADGLPAHHASAFEHRRDGNTIVSRIDPGDGNAPDLASEVVITDERDLVAEWNDAFDSWEDCARYLVEQNRAVSAAPMLGGILASNIDIPIAVEDVEPARGEIESAWLAELVEGCEPLCFVVPSVRFRALGEVVTARSDET